MGVARKYPLWFRNQTAIITVTSEKVRIGVLGAYRVMSMINYCKKSNNAEVVAICDKLPEALNAQRKNAEGLNIAFYDHFDDFILHDMDAVVLANYANEHAPFAIRAMKRVPSVMAVPIFIRCTILLKRFLGTLRLILSMSTRLLKCSCRACLPTVPS